jgi:hypothetical protein
MLSNSLEGMKMIFDIGDICSRPVSRERKMDIHFESFKAVNTPFSKCICSIERFYYCDMLYGIFELCDNYFQKQIVSVMCGDQLNSFRKSQRIFAKI